MSLGENVLFINSKRVLRNLKKITRCRYPIAEIDKIRRRQLNNNSLINSRNTSRNGRRVVYVQFVFISFRFEHPFRVIVKIIDYNKYTKTVVSNVFN